MSFPSSAKPEPQLNRLIRTRAEATMNVPSHRWIESAVAIPDSMFSLSPGENDDWLLPTTNALQEFQGTTKQRPEASGKRNLLDLLSKAIDIVSDTACNDEDESLLVQRNLDGSSLQ